MFNCRDNNKSSSSKPQTPLLLPKADPKLTQSCPNTNTLLPRSSLSFGIVVRLPACIGCVPCGSLEPSQSQ